MKEKSIKIKDVVIFVCKKCILVHVVKVHYCCSIIMFVSFRRTSLQGIIFDRHTYRLYYMSRKLT